jgi:hypothetical protein
LMGCSAEAARGTCRRATERLAHELKDII